MPMVCSDIKPFPPLTTNVARSLICLCNMYYGFILFVSAYVITNRTNPDQTTPSYCPLGADWLGIRGSRGGGRGPPFSPGKITNYMGFYREKVLLNKVNLFCKSSGD